jgi:N-acetylglucosaminyl-diphospho-decaprenol L-rhamnosyltransferase
MSEGSKIAVVVVNYRTPDLTMRCMAALSVERSLLPSLTAIVVDGGSEDGSAQALEKALSHPDYRGWASFLPLALNGGYGWANNQAILTLSRDNKPPDFIHLLNPDTEVEHGAVAQLFKELERSPDCGAAGSQLLACDGHATASAFRFPSPAREFVGAAQSAVIGRVLGIPGIVVLPHENRDVDWVSGASVMFRVRALRETGLFDDGFFLYFEEVELLHRMKSFGWTVRHVPSSRVVHVEGAATGVGANASDRPFPAYWYRSRRRYFELTGGAAALVAANTCSLAGQAIAGIKKIAGRPGANQSYRTFDLIRLGFWPSGSAARPSVPRLGDMPGQAPAWMRKT